MRKVLGILALLLFAITAVFAGEWVAINSQENPFDVAVVSSDGNSTVLQYTVNGYSINDAVINGKHFTLFDKMRKEAVIEEQGYPRLPRINRSIIIPDNGIMGYEIISSEYTEIENIDVAPSKGNILRSVDPSTVPYTFAECYNEDAFYPGNIVEIGEPYIVRDLRGTVVKLNAFQYNPITRTLRIYTDVTIKVNKIASGGDNVIQRSEPLTTMVSEFHKMYQRHFINYDEMDYPTLYEEGEMLIICYDNWLEALEPLAEWKTQKGMLTTLVPLSTVGTNTTAIKNYIQAAYNQIDLAYVLLIGDHQQLPTFSSGSDPVYSTLAGGDDYPDIFVGRFSAQTAPDLITQVIRTLEYEQEPQAGADWYHMGLGIASNQGPGHHGEYDDEHETLIAYKLLNYTYTQVDSVYDYWGTQTMINNALNEGRSIINYTGHGSTTSWGTTGFNNSSVNNLTNDNMLPHIVSVACNNGTFTSTTCFAEAWLRATNNGNGEPTGAVGAYMSKISQSWNPPMDMQDEGVDLMVADEMRTFGGICFNGSMLMIDLNGGSGVNEFKNWTIFGDPSLYLRNDTPIALTVTHDPVLFIGLNTFDVTVTGPTGPVEGALVCGMNDEVYATGYTNSSGQLTLEFDEPPTQPGTLNLTVTAWNAIPEMLTVDIIPPSGPYVVYSGNTIDDDIYGNDNGQLDWDEEIEIGMTVENVGVEIAENVVGTISSTDPLVTIYDDEAEFGNILPSSSTTVDHAYRIEVSHEVEDLQYLSFLLSATDGIDTWETNFMIQAHAPNILYAELTVDDIAGGNGNGNLDPGETADLYVTLINDGSSEVVGLNSELICTDPNIIINNGVSGVFGIITPGMEVDMLFNISVSPSCPQEHEVEFGLEIEGGASLYTNSIAFTSIVGNILYAPSGPDSYGYIAYDLYDAPIFTEFEWIEICPDSGGLGTEVAFTQDDQVLHFALPFNFQYYGVEYDSFTVSSNGWVGMGVVRETDYSNSGIPDSDGPAPMIATYWEDMSPQRTNSGGVWYYYDAAEEILVIEFNHVEQFSPTGDFETFQTILYDPAEYPTVTGDGKIKMQYKDMSAASQEEGTMGIENHLENDGIEYCYDGDYDVHAAAITAGSAVLYSTPTDMPNLEIVLEPASLPIIIPSSGGSFEYDLTITNNGAVTAFFDGWIDVVLPNMIETELLLRPGISLAPAGQLFRSMTQNVPASAPTGDYTYRGWVGNHPGMVYDSDQFDFEKLAGDGIGTGGTWGLTGWDEEETTLSALVPDVYYLDQNYPNPFNPETIISFGLPNDTRVSLKVFNILGENVATLVEGYLSAGNYQFNWQADDVSSGLYFYRLQAEGFTSVKKMMLIR